MNTIRRKDREISSDEALTIVEKGEYGILSMCTTENEGYGIPLNYILDENRIYFHCAVEGTKLNYLRANNKVSFCVVGNTKIVPSEFGTLYESVIVFGKTLEVDGAEKQNALEKIVEKYSKDYTVEGKDYIAKRFDRVKIIKIEINQITGKARKQ
jgi:uncharacterized protein